MKTIMTAALIAALGSVGAAAQAATADAGAGAKIIAPLQIAKKTDLYFGTIAPSLTDDDSVVVGADGSRTCGPALTCLSADHTAALFAVTGEADAVYTVSLPDSIAISNGAGAEMKVSNFASSKDSGTLASGTDSFTVGGTLAVAALQAAGRYTGTFTVAVEYQ